MPPTLLPADAVRLAQRARRLLRAGKLSHTAYIVLDNLLWSARPKGVSHAVISYCGLSRLTHLAKATIAAALKALEAVRLITKVKRRALFQLPLDGMDHPLLERGVGWEPLHQPKGSFHVRRRHHWP